MLTLKRQHHSANLNVLSGISWEFGSYQGVRVGRRRRGFIESLPRPGSRLPPSLQEAQVRLQWVLMLLTDREKGALWHFYLWCSHKSQMWPHDRHEPGIRSPKVTVIPSYAQIILHSVFPQSWLPVVPCPSPLALSTPAEPISLCGGCCHSSAPILPLQPKIPISGPLPKLVHPYTLCSVQHRTSLTAGTQKCFYDERFIHTLPFVWLSTQELIFFRLSSAAFTKSTGSREAW